MKWWPFKKKFDDKNLFDVEELRRERLSEINNIADSFKLSDIAHARLVYLCAMAETIGVYIAERAAHQAGVELMNKIGPDPADEWLKRNPEE